MKEYINEIISVLYDKIDFLNKDKAYLFRLDNFVHPQIYLNVCQFFKGAAVNEGITFNAKLSKEQYAIFSKYPEFQHILETLDEEGYVEKESQMTTWRNSVADQKGLLFLMGTESVQDKGGLADFYKVSPEVIERHVGKSYASWFIRLIDTDDRSETTAVNHFLENLFRIIPKDLFKLSCIVDHLEEQKLQGLEEVLTGLGHRFTIDWGLPSVHSFDTKTIVQLSKEKKFDLIDKANKFKNRAEFKDSLTKAKFSKLKSKIAEFKVSDKMDEFAESVEQAKQLFGSFENFEEALLDYFKGKNLDVIRPQLFQLDFNFINAIVNLKISKKPTPEKETVVKVYGSPIEAFTKIICDSLTAARGNGEFECKPRIIFSVNEAILSNYVEDDENDLYNAWSRICFATGGIIGYLQEELEERIEICFSNAKDPFILSSLEEFSIKPTKGTQTLSNISITVEITGLDKPIEYKWVFNPNEYWLHTFDIHVLDKLIEFVSSRTKFLPVFYTNVLGNLLGSVDTDVFFHQLSETDKSFINVFDLLPAEIEEGIIATKLFQLSKPFKEFLTELRDNGLYYTIDARKSSTALNFINKYVEVVQTFIKNTANLTTTEKRNAHIISNVFLLLRSKESCQSKYQSGVVVLPFHPAMLEKIIEQQAFYRKGLSNLLDNILMGTTKKQYDRVIENISRQSTIISGIDTILSDISDNQLTKRVFGYYALHGEILEEGFLESMALLDSDLVFDEDFNTKEMLTSSFMSHLIEERLMEYAQTFPAQADCIKIGFVNFEHLQPVVAGVHAFIGKFKGDSHVINIKLQVISPSHLQSGRTYVNFWLDNFFNEEDNVRIETYYKSVNLENGNISLLEETLFNHDIIFVNDVMATGDIDYVYSGETNISPSDTRFPMVFHPMPVYESDQVRRISISQRQFQASFVHSQLVHWIKFPDNKEGVYRVEKELFLSEHMKQVLDLLHEKARWVITLDTALDRKFFNNDKVISFSTGEGPYGELNMTVSAASKVREDVTHRLVKRLRDIFPAWDKEKLESCARYCIEESKELDGIKILKALNPYDYEVHSFLSYILSVKSLDIKQRESEVVLKAYIPMDSYRHWFSDISNRPDYLLVEIQRDSIRPDFVEIDATVVECKMGKESSVHVEKGLDQLSNSVSYLSEIFNGNSHIYSRRYWFAQLYRALVFSPNFVANSEEEQRNFNQSLLNILEGNFKINWSAKLLTYWLDYNQEVVGQESMRLDGTTVACSHESFGQLYIQKNLLPGQLSTEIQYVEIGKDLLSFANSKEDFEMLTEEYGHELLEDDEENNVGHHEKDKTNKRIIDLDRVEQETDQNQGDQVYSNNLNKVGDKDAQTLHTGGKGSDKQNPQADEHESSDDLERSGVDIDKSPVEHNNPDQDTIAEQHNLEKVRVLLGKDIRTQQDIYWEYGHPQLENRHILISGKSGVGKTYFIQCLLYGLTQQRVPSIIFDYTDGFKNNKLEPEFKEGLQGKIEQFYVYQNSFPINPFKKNQKQLDEDVYVPETDTDVAERLKSVFRAIYKLGDQQANSIYRATMNGLKKYKDAMNLEYLRKELEADGSSYAQTTLSRLEPLIDRNPFDTQSQYNWDEHFANDPKVFVVQLLGFTRDVQLIITEFILWDLWNYKLSHGDKANPFASIIDEAQNLDHSEVSPSAKILTEGRKFGWSGWYATQFMQGQLGKDEIQRLQNASQKIYFAPPEEEINNIASYLDTDSYKRKEWAKKLAALRKGQCIVWGPILKADGSLERTGPRIVDVTSLAERMKR